MNADLLDAQGVAAPPRRNGELIFDAPWQSRIFGLCAAIVETCFDGDREPFRRQLIAAITAEPDRPYWDSWTIALQQLVLDAGLLDEISIERHTGLPQHGNKASQNRMMAAAVAGVPTPAPGMTPDAPPA